MAITKVAILDKMAILTISEMAIYVINKAILGIQLKSIKKLAQWCLIHIKRTFRLDIIKTIVFLKFSRLLTM